MDEALLRQLQADTLRAAAAEFRKDSYGLHLYPADLDVVAAQVEQGRIKLTLERDLV